MRWDLTSPLTDVKPDDPVGVDGIPLVGIDDNAKESGVSLNTYFIRKIRFNY